MKRLYRSDDNKVFAGVCGGLGEYTDVDPVMFRVLWVIVTILTGVFPGIIAYIITIFVVPPMRNKGKDRSDHYHERGHEHNCACSHGGKKCEDCGDTSKDTHVHEERGEEER